MLRYCYRQGKGTYRYSFVKRFESAKGVSSAPPTSRSIWLTLFCEFTVNMVQLELASATRVVGSTTHTIGMEKPVTTRSHALPALP